MGRLIFYVLVGLGGAAFVIDGGIHNRWFEFVVGLVIALGVQVMLGTGWWLKWQRTVEPQPSFYFSLWSRGPDDWGGYARLADRDAVTFPQTSGNGKTHITFPPYDWAADPWAPEDWK